MNTEGCCRAGAYNDPDGVLDKGLANPKVRRNLARLVTDRGGPPVRFAPLAVVGRTDNTVKNTASGRRVALMGSASGAWAGA